MSCLYSNGRKSAKYYSSSCLEAVVMTSVSRPTHFVSHFSSPIVNMSIDSSFMHPRQMPSKKNFQLFFYL